MNDKSSTIYCSLDIETSGFDPLKNEILEVGFVLFVIEADKNAEGAGAGKTTKIKILEEYTRVFKPKGPVPAAILGLTGITEAELDEAENFEDHKAGIQAKLKDAVIVGHNVIFDIKFLESVGISFSGKIVDTLDLVQFILPTHHSYNLENLMHLFQVSHKDAHRALADAKACLVVLEKLLSLFHNFPQSLQRQIIDISQEQSFVWTELLAVNANGDVRNQTKHTSALASIQELVEPRFALESRVIYNFQVGNNCVEEIISTLAQQKKKALLVVPRISQIVSAWKQGLVTPAFGSEMLFSKEKFEAFMQKPKNADEAKFALKILIWFHTNWQTLSVFDLNLSFFGGQFKSFITGGDIIEQKSALVVCCDMNSLPALMEQDLYKSRIAVMVGLNEFEQYISSSLSVKASWSYITYVLKSFYNPELGTGNVELKTLVEEGLNKSDLFFGLVHALLKEENEQFQYYTVTTESFNYESFVKIRLAANNYAEYLELLNGTVISEQISKFIENIKAFFEPDENYVKWIELAESRCVLFSTPIDIASAAKSVISYFKSTSFADSLGSQKLLDYFRQRLGLSHFSVEKIAPAKKKQVSQGDLFQFIKNKLHFAPKQSIVCSITSKPFSKEELFSILSSAEFPAAVLFGNVLQVKEFYDAYYEQLKKKVTLVAQNNAGGSNKIFHNFSIHSNTLLLGTGKFILKHLATSSSVQPVDHLRVKTLIICNLPFDQFTHPYQKAVSARFSNPFEDYSLPKAVYNFHALLEFFNTDSLQRIYISDSKLSKGYGAVFTDYIQQVPSVVIK